MEQSEAKRRRKVDGSKEVCVSNKCLLDLPEEILEYIIKLSVNCVSEYDTISQVCRKFKKIMQHKIWYKSITIYDDVSFRAVMRILDERHTIIEKIELRDTMEQEIVNYILRTINIIRALKSFKIKASILNHDSINYIRYIIIKHRRSLTSLKFVHIQSDGLLLYEGIWLNLLQLLPNNQLKEFSFTPFYLPAQFINQFIDNQRESLTSLKVYYFAGKNISIETLARCTNLKVLRLVIGFGASIVNPEGALVFPWQNLTKFSLYSCEQELNVPLCQFLSGPFSRNFKKISLLPCESEHQFYNSYLDLISRHCRHVEEIVFLFRIRGLHLIHIPLNTILNVLRTCPSLKYISIPNIELPILLQLESMINANAFPRLYLFSTTINLHGRVVEDIRQQLTIFAPVNSRAFPNHCKIEYRKFRD